MKLDHEHREGLSHSGQTQNMIPLFVLWYELITHLSMYYLQKTKAIHVGKLFVRYNMKKSLIFEEQYD